MKHALFFALCQSILISFSPLLKAADYVIDRPLDEFGFPKPIPVTISGFSGEVDTVLKNDLLFMGVQNVAPSEARFLITGSNAERVEGRVTQKATQAEVFARAYTGGS